MQNSSTALLAEQPRAIRYGRVNLVVCLAQILAWGLCIHSLHHLHALALQIIVLVFFCVMMLGVFSMMHDAIHGLAHPNRQINLVIGMLSATIFGTAYTLFRINHEGHHVRNRTPPEIAEFILSGENALIKTGVYYFAILGGIWLSSFLTSLLLPFLPFKWVCKLNRPAQSMNGYSISFTQFKQADLVALRVESFFMVMFWVAAIYLFDWHWQVLVVAYVAFSFVWSSMQWVYHLRTPLDPVEGAYNLRSPVLIRLLLLNFSYNLTHHRHPRLHWQELYVASEPSETQPLWYRYLLVFLPPEPLPADLSSLEKIYF